MQQQKLANINPRPRRAVLNHPQREGSANHQRQEPWVKICLEKALPQTLPDEFEAVVAIGLRELRATRRVREFKHVAARSAVRRWALSE